MSCWDCDPGLAEGCSGCVTRRVAVDVAGEDGGIRKILIEAERAARLLGYHVNRRTHREQWAAADAPFVTDSERLSQLRSAQEHMRWATQALTAALIATGTMTDEPPF